MKRKMILADSDERYLKELSCYFMENVPQLELITFTKKEKLMEYLERGNSADILVVDELLADAALKKLTPNTTRIVMSVSMSPAADFEVIKKYQRMENLSGTILLKYAEENGTLDAVKGNRKTRTTVFFNPAGGTGKTTLALALAAAGARAGQRTLYLNLEDIDSVSDILPKTEGTLSEVFLALKTKGMNPGIKLKVGAGIEPMAGFAYISGVESVSEYEEISSEEIKRLLHAIQELADYDLVIVDQSSGFTDRTKELLIEADMILVPVTTEEGNAAKLQRLLNESRLHAAYDSLFRKMYMIVNKTGANGSAAVQLPKEVSSQIPICTSIAALDILAKKKNILQLSDQMLQIMNPVLRLLIHGNS